MHATIKKVTDDIETLSFNTAIAQMMIFVNAFTNVASETAARDAHTCSFCSIRLRRTSLQSLWETLNAKFSDVRGDITEQSWPNYDERFLVEDEVEIVVQVNGKLRDKIDGAAHGHGR